MEDLENLLLEVAGRTGSSGRNRHARPPSNRKREGSYSDDGSDSKDDDSDDDRGYVSRKAACSHVPLKKRLDVSEKDDERRDDDDYEDEDHRGGSSEDSDGEELAKMTELQREMILSDRAQKRDDQRLAERMQRGKETPQPPLSRVRSSARSAEKGRMRHQDHEVLEKMDASREVKRLLAGCFPKEKSHMEASPSSSSQSESHSGSHSRGDGSAGDEGMGDSDEDRLDKLTFEDIKEITIRRSKLSKWFMEPVFEDLIVGYMVRNVDASGPDKQYKMDNKYTHKYLNRMQGNSAARWEMIMVSDSPPLESEFKEWVEAVKCNDGRMPSAGKVLEKRKLFKSSNLCVLCRHCETDHAREEINIIKAFENVAAEKDRPRKEMDIAESRCDIGEAERIGARLLELESSRQSKEAGYDPFSRRWTRSRNYYVLNATEGDETAASVMRASCCSFGSGDGRMEGGGYKCTVDLGTESNSLHNFDLANLINELESLEEHKELEAGFMARKQRIEATVGKCVPENDGRRHSLTLTVVITRDGEVFFETCMNPPLWTNNSEVTNLCQNLQFRMIKVILFYFLKHVLYCYCVVELSCNFLCCNKDYGLY
ncbi:hypothetical protein MKW92_000059 [Papaver armeniacum]|nr:hypothetical protein MKW92_000059 [Papaver armeniacum]